MFESQLLKTGVTTANFINNYIVAGIGDFLNIYQRTPPYSFLNKVKIFDGHNVHGVEVKGSQKLLIFGANYTKILECDWPNLKLLDSQTFKDWILSARWLPNNKVGLTLMLNRLLICDDHLVVLKEISCEEKCMLYSSFIHVYSTEELIIFSGTVFSEILIWKASVNDQVTTGSVKTKLNGHKGVIFCISYNENSSCIASSSDDRSTIIWSFDAGSCEAKQLCKVYGHQSRVFRCLMLDTLLVTAGEDSTVNVWTLEGKLVKKIDAHQGGSIWALNSDGNVILSGSDNSGLSLISVGCNEICGNTKVGKIPKRVGILQSGNLVLMSEEGTLMYFNRFTKEWKVVDQHDNLKSYHLLEVSKCRYLVSLSGFHGEIYIYREQNKNLKLIVVHKTKNEARIFSFHWLTCSTFITCEPENLNLWCLQNCLLVLVRKFNFPAKLRNVWTTTACQTGNGNYLLGDRKGNIYVYSLASSDPIRCLYKAHTYLGVTKLYKFDHYIISLGRNGVVKCYDERYLLEVSSDKLPLNWLVGMEDNKLVIAFSGQNFVLWDYESRRILLEHKCGGGHRSWDFAKMDNNSLIFVYVKDNSVKLLECDYNELCSKNIIPGFHNNTVNSLKVLRLDDVYLSISGGEDTTLRISIFREHHYESVKSIKSHLSSVRAICVCDCFSDFLFFSGGGRGQIVCWKLKGFQCYQQCSYYESVESEFSEIRVMDLVVAGKLLLAATSEGRINLFSIDYKNGKYQIDLIRSLHNKLKCITKICSFKTKNIDILISMSTDGNVSFWNLDKVSTGDDVVPFKIKKIHQSGINTCSYQLFNKNLLVLLTGGDDNCISLNLFRLFENDSTVIEHVDSYENNWSHCAQITGTYLTDTYFLTTSIDQKLYIFKWKIEDSKFVCTQLSRYNTSLSDIQGMECCENDKWFDVFLYGRGVEFIKCYK